MNALCWVVVGLGFFCVLVVGVFIWVSQRTYHQMLAKIDRVPQAPVWSYTKEETTYYDPKYASPSEKVEDPQ